MAFLSDLEWLEVLRWRKAYVEWHQRVTVRKVTCPALRIELLAQRHHALKG